MANVTLADIRAAAEEKYGSYDIDLGNDGVVTLLNPLKLDKPVREAVKTFQDRMKAEDADQVALIQDMLVQLAATRAQGQKLVKAIGKDLPVLIEVFSAYGKATKVGEASASHN